MISSGRLVRRTVGHAVSLPCAAEPPRSLYHFARAALVRHGRFALLVLMVAGCSDSTGPRTGGVQTAPGTTVTDLNAVTGRLAVTVVKNVDFDPNGFSLNVDGGVPTFVPGIYPGYEQSTEVSGLSAGAHSLTLSGVAGNCTASVLGPLSVTISRGATTQVLVTILCAMHEQDASGSGLKSFGKT
jgi:hypothetical protein